MSAEIQYSPRRPTSRGKGKCSSGGGNIILWSQYIITTYGGNAEEQEMTEKKSVKRHKAGVGHTFQTKNDCNFIDFVFYCGFDMYSKELLSVVINVHASCP